MIEGLVESFAALDNPRCPGKVEHRLADVLVVAVCTVVAEAGTFEGIALYGCCKEGWLRSFLKLLEPLRNPMRAQKSSRALALLGVAPESSECLAAV